MDLKTLPSVDRLLKDSTISSFISSCGRDAVLYAVRSVTGDIRSAVLAGKEDYCGMPVACISQDDIVNLIKKKIEGIVSPSLRPVINGTGIILHTNLGRAPLGKELVSRVASVLEGYTNLEFDLEKGRRGERNSHAVEIIKYLTSAEDAVFVNNNAAGVMFVLSAFASGRECVVSRGELVEIGGSFRVPDIMALSGSRMVEVGTTNKTRISDYENAVNGNTAIFFKAHRSNFRIEGFTEEVSLKELSDTAARYGLVSVYDIGSGLLRRVDRPELADEPVVKDAIEAGIDLVCFSGDKLLGAGQVGIIAGKSRYISVLKKHPLFRALRVCKTTLAVLETACSYYLDDRRLFEGNVLFRTLVRDAGDVKNSAVILASELNKRNVDCSVVRSEGQYGGGTMPDMKIESYSVKIGMSAAQRNSDLGKVLFHKMLLAEKPVLANLRSGEIYIDMLCVDNADLDYMASMVAEKYSETV